MDRLHDEGGRALGGVDRQRRLPDSLDAPAERRNVSDGRDGYDNDPTFSPDGTKLAWHSMERPGFESDRNRILVLDLESEEVTEPTAGLDQTVHGATWTADSGSFVFASEWRGTNQLFHLPLGGGEPVSSPRASTTSVWWTCSPVERLFVSVMDMKRPRELAILSMEDAALRMVTDVNAEHYEGLALPGVEERWVEATDGKRIHCWVIFPPDFDPSKKYPLLTYCQGGPQGQIGQWFSYRWNFHLMAAQGYVVMHPTGETCRAAGSGTTRSARTGAARR